jgi:GT2 family glycosyltransferase
MPLRFSFIVPFHRDLASLARCLEGLSPLPADSELIVVADGGVEDCFPLASLHHARILLVAGGQATRPSGPAVARNTAAAVAGGEVLVFIDADVVVSRAGLSRLAAVFQEQPQTAAVFGSYDDRPADPGFVSQYKNLSHCFVHRTAAAEARTFWAGFGAVRRDAFRRVGGFDERFTRPSVEDIDLGYRLTEAGYGILLEPALAATHLKRWTVGSTIASDVRDRGIPWTQLIWRYRALGNDLNLRTEYRLSVVLAYLAVLLLALGSRDRRLFTALPPLMAAMALINHRYYRFLYSRRGAWFAARAFAMRGLQDLGNGLAFAAGSALFLSAHHLGRRLPGALSPESWTARPSRQTVSEQA